MSDIVTYVTQNPDPFAEGCANTGEVADGIVFNGVDPDAITVCFIGRQSIIEAFGEMHRLTPVQVKKLLKAHEDLKKKESERVLLENEVRRWRDFGERMEENGLVIQLME